MESPYPLETAARNRWVRERRPHVGRPAPDRPWAFFPEEERADNGRIVSSAVVFLTNRECPWGCLMCDLWRNTTSRPVPRGAIPAQIDHALERLPATRQIKLYNSGSFFDAGAIPPSDYAAIAARMARFDRVIVECHPALIGERCWTFQRQLRPHLEVALGLETANPSVLAQLNKGVTLDSFRRAADGLRAHDVALRAFVLVQPPFQDQAGARGCAGRTCCKSSSRRSRAVRAGRTAGGGRCRDLPPRSGTLARRMGSGRRFAAFGLPLAADLSQIHPHQMNIPVPKEAWLERSSGERVPLVDNCSIGRSDDNHIVLVDKRVSRRHALLHMQGEGEWWLVDLGSSNGTYINQGRVSQPSRLRDADAIGVGPFVLTFRQSEGRMAAEPDWTAERTALDLRATPCWLLVADVEGSTTMGQRLADEEVAVLMGRWFAACQEVLERHGGIINKYLGDGFFAYWPHAEAARPGLIEAVRELKRLQEAGTPAFRMVLHHGQVVMGGRASLGEESLSGREVNLVFRMEKLSGHLRQARLLSEPARRLLADSLATTEVGSHALPGFPESHPFFTF